MRILLLSFLWPYICIAAPHPATSTSALTSPEGGLYFLHKGFTLKSMGTQWIPVASGEEPSANSIRLGPKDSTSHGTLNVRTEKVQKAASLELYTRKWMRDYPNYGFEVLSAKNFSLNNQPALVVDLISHSKNKQLRQVVLKRNDKAVIMTCLDDRATFSKTLQVCNTIIKSFTWDDTTTVSQKK